MTMRQDREKSDRRDDSKQLCLSLFCNSRHRQRERVCGRGGGGGREVLLSDRGRKGDHYSFGISSLPVLQTVRLRKTSFKTHSNWNLTTQKLQVLDKEVICSLCNLSLSFLPGCVYVTSSPDCSSHGPWLSDPFNQSPTFLTTLFEMRLLFWPAAWQAFLFIRPISSPLN